VSADIAAATAHRNAFMNFLPGMRVFVCKRRPLRHPVSMFERHS
jgi:hypothetical protein